MCFCQIRKVITVDGLLKVTIQIPGLLQPVQAKYTLALLLLTQGAAASAALADIEPRTCLLVSTIFLLLLTNYESGHIKGQREAHIERS